MNRVGKQYLIDCLVDGGFTLADAEKAVDFMIDAQADALRTGHSVSISNFGTLRLVRVPARTRRNPQTGEYFDAPASVTVRWKPSPTFLDVLNGRAFRSTLATKAPKGSV